VTALAGKIGAVLASSSASGVALDDAIFMPRPEKMVAPESELEKLS
jgi:hypothetical protein